MSKINEEKINFVSKTLIDLFFNNNHQPETIDILLADTPGYKQLKKDLNHKSYDSMKLVWATNSDNNLAEHMINMYIKTTDKQLLNYSFEKFKTLWRAYCKTDLYFQQIVSYILNSDDYVYGDRYHLIQSKNIPNIRPSKYLANTMKLWEQLNEDENKKRQYYSKVFALARHIKHYAYAKESGGSR